MPLPGNVHPGISIAARSLHGIPSSLALPRPDGAAIILILALYHRLEITANPNDLLAARHVTTYRYRRPVTFGEHRLMFRPRDSYDQKLLEARLSISPEPANVRWLHDVFGNCVTVVDFDEPCDELRFESNIWLDHAPSNTPDFRIEDEAATFPFAYAEDEMPDLAPLDDATVPRCRRARVGAALRAPGAADRYRRAADDD